MVPAEDGGPSVLHLTIPSGGIHVLGGGTPWDPALELVLHSAVGKVMRSLPSWASQSSEGGRNPMLTTVTTLWGRCQTVCKSWKAGQK